jgi:hypothetical protein
VVEHESSVVVGVVVLIFMRESDRVAVVSEEFDT